jgi:cell division protein FtsW
MNRSGVPALFFPILILYATGMLMIFDASSGEIVDLALGKSQFAGFSRQLIWGCAGVAAAFGAYRLGWRYFFEQSTTLYLALLVLLVLVFVPGIGVGANGSRRWVGWHGFVIQPSEFMKIVLPAFFISSCIKDVTVFRSFSSFLKLLGKVGVAVCLIALEPNNGTSGVVALLIGILTVIVGIPPRFWGIPLCLAAVLLGGVAASSGYVQQRMATYLHPEMDLKGKGHQPYQAKIAAGSGGLFGRGPAKSMQKLSYLPEAQNDYIAAIFAEEFGFVGMTLLIGVYVWLLHEIWRMVHRATSNEAFLWGLAFFSLIAIQTFMNLGVVSGLLPSTGLNLPFFSQGGSSLVANCIGCGLLVSMVREGQPGSVYQGSTLRKGGEPR